jgi:hypothetical protein
MIHREITKCEKFPTQPKIRLCYKTKVNEFFNFLGILQEGKKTIPQIKMIYVSWQCLHPQ